MPGLADLPRGKSINHKIGEDVEAGTADWVSSNPARACRTSGFQAGCMIITDLQGPLNVHQCGCWQSCIVPRTKFNYSIRTNAIRWIPWRALIIETEPL